MLNLHIRMNFRFLLAVSFMWLVLTSPLFSQNNENHPNLFTEIAPGNLNLSAKQRMILDLYEQNKTTIELKVVRIDIGLLTNNDIIRFNLSSSENFQATKARIDSRGSNDFTWYGNIENKSGYSIVSVWEEAVAGYVIAANSAYTIRSLGEGLFTAIKVDPTQALPCGLIRNMAADKEF